MDEQTFKRLLHEALKSFATKDDLKNELKKQKEDICNEIGEQINDLVQELDEKKADKILVLSHEQRITDLENKITHN